MRNLRHVKARAGSGSWCAWCDRLLGEVHEPADCSCQPECLSLAARSWLDGWKAHLRWRQVRLAPPRVREDDALEDLKLTLDGWTFTLGT